MPLGFLDGNGYLQSALKFKFKVDELNKKICSRKLTEKEIKIFKYTIKHQYWYELYLDGLPIWAMVGQNFNNESTSISNKKNTAILNSETSGIYSHKLFSIGYNKDRIIEVNFTVSNPITLIANTTINFTYSVVWFKTNGSFTNRFNRYLDHSFFEDQIHWFSILNSLALVIILCAFVFILYTTLITSPNTENSELNSSAEENQLRYSYQIKLKELRRDVFRVPTNLTSYAAFYGIGMQLFATVLLVILTAICKSEYMSFSDFVSTILFCYMITSVIAGYFSSSIYQQYYNPKNNPHWIQCMILTAGFVPFSSFGIFMILNSVLSYYRAVNIISFGGFIWILLVWLVIVVPLTFMSTLIGRNSNKKPQMYHHVNLLPRHIPMHRWYTHRIIIICLSGWLPFGSVFLETYYLFTSFWNYKFYYIWGFCLTSFILLICVVICVSILSTFFLLKNGDYRWPWFSFFASASVAGYIYIYSIYYFFANTKICNYLHVLNYFCYNALACLILGIMCGSVGSASARLFIQKIYDSIRTS